MSSRSQDRAELERSTERWMWAGLVLMVLFALVFPIYRLYEPSRRAEARESQLGFLAAQGEELYVGECSTCHGVRGRGGIGPAIGSKNFLESVEDRQITQLIALGVPGTEMVAYSIDNGGPMTSEEIEAISVYLRSLEEDAEANPLWQTPLEAEDLTGLELYAMACARCHGNDRLGVEDLGPDISATSFALEESDEWLAGRIREGRNEMPRFGRVLTERQIELLVAFLRGEAPPTDTTVGADTTQPPDGEVDPAVIEFGQEVYEGAAGGAACAACHGSDGQGSQLGPNIVGASKGAIGTAIDGGVAVMESIDLTPEELEAVYQYVRSLSP